MAQIKLTVDRISREELVALARRIHSQMTGNADFPAPVPSLATLGAAISAVEAATLELHLLRQQMREKLAELGGLEAALRGDLRDLAAYVRNVSGGDEATILGAGMGVRRAKSPRTMAPATGLEALPGEDSGEIDLSWTPVPGAKSYEVQGSPDPITATSWGHAGISTKATLTLTGLPSGARGWWRVRAIGANGPGAWSDPATKIVP